MRLSRVSKTVRFPRWQMTSPSFNSWSRVLSKEDAASIAALQAQIETFKQQRNLPQATECLMRACAIINRAALKSLTSGNYANGETVGFIDASLSGGKTFTLELELCEDSPLAREIVEVLKRH